MFVLQYSIWFLVRILEIFSKLGLVPQRSFNRAASWIVGSWWRWRWISLILRKYRLVYELLSARELTPKGKFDFKNFTIWGDLKFIKHHPPGSPIKCYFLFVSVFILIFWCQISHFCLTGQMMWANVELNPSFLDATWMRWFEQFFFLFSEIRRVLVAGWGW